MPQIASHEAVKSGRTQRDVEGGRRSFRQPPALICEPAIH